MRKKYPQFFILPGLCLALGFTVGYLIGTSRGVRLAERRAAYLVVPEAEARALYGRRIGLEQYHGVNSVPINRKQVGNAP